MHWIKEVKMKIPGEEDVTRAGNEKERGKEESVLLVFLGVWVGVDGMGQGQGRIVDD